MDSYLTKKCTGSTSSGADANPAKTQITIDESIARTAKCDIDSSQAQDIHKAIAELIAVDCQPISIVEVIGFERLMKKVKPNYSIFLKSI